MLAEQFFEVSMDCKMLFIKIFFFNSYVINAYVSIFHK
ncbi:hypothetical protein SSPSH_002125 [Salinisphaera shabanensis E1L3A]|uniref:Uncharacterized protein n=1 Tax=Salinisphaera shabanensis E1L3A TaxID=1033802 RepID=A0ACB4V5Z6_9GAMM|nr:hypothetical protein SSPSH_002125 [Salinisphaera shabanensis E1L3A]